MVSSKQINIYIIIFITNSVLIISFYFCLIFLFNISTFVFLYIFKYIIENKKSQDMLKIYFKTKFFF